MNTSLKTTAAVLTSFFLVSTAQAMMNQDHTTSSPEPDGRTLRRRTAQPQDDTTDSSAPDGEALQRTVQSQDDTTGSPAPDGPTLQQTVQPQDDTTGSPAPDGRTLQQAAQPMVLLKDDATDPSIDSPAAPSVFDGLTLRQIALINTWPSEVELDPKRLSSEEIDLLREHVQLIATISDNEFRPVFLLQIDNYSYRMSGELFDMLFPNLRSIGNAFPELTRRTVLRTCVPENAHPLSHILELVREGLLSKNSNVTPAAINSNVTPAAINLDDL